MPGLLVVLLLVAAICAVVFFLQWQSTSHAVLALKAEADAARKDTEAARAEQRKAQDELKQQKVLLAEAREKLADVRRKAQDGKAKPVQLRSTREAELEEDLQHARQLADEAHAAEQAARRERDEARAAAHAARTELEKAQSLVRELAARKPEPPPPPPAAPDLGAVRAEAEAEKNKLAAQLDELQKALKEAKRREQDLRDDVRRYRGRAETNNRVYLVTKGELDLTKERLAQAERKLWQAGIPVPPPEKKERPKATGPAAADRRRDGKPADDTDGQRTVSPDLAAAEMPTEASVPAPESIPTPVEAPAPQAVQPIRRRPEEAAKPEHP